MPAVPGIPEREGLLSQAVMVCKSKVETSVFDAFGLLDHFKNDEHSFAFLGYDGVHLDLTRQPVFLFEAPLLGNRTADRVFVE